MDHETARYIIKYFSELLTEEERIAIRHTTSEYKLEHSANTTLTKIYREKGWLTSDQSVLDLLKDGYESFEQNVANRIIRQNPGRVIFNLCLKCGKLARTPYAKQCRHCGYNWHNVAKAETKYKYRYRPGYGSDELLIDIFHGAENDGFLVDFSEAVASLNPTLKEVQDLWMNDEILMEFESDCGAFILSKDIWGFAFVMAAENQKGLEKIHQLLSSDINFESITVNNDDYKIINKI
jgi:ribosomal protein L40E